MTAKEGWITLGVAVLAGIIVYLFEIYFPAGPRNSRNLPTTIGRGGTAPVTTGSPLAHGMLSDQSDVDSGQGVQPQIQTEAAYNVGSTGTADGITTGMSPQESDHETFDDSSEVLSQ